MKKLLTATAVTAMLISSAAIAKQHTMAMADVDADADSMVSMEEYDAGLTADRERRFGLYDTDQDGNITSEEFAAGEFNRYDEDRDGNFSEAEYTAYTEDDARFETDM